MKTLNLTELQNINGGFQTSLKEYNFNNESLEEKLIRLGKVIVLDPREWQGFDVKKH